MMSRDIIIIDIEWDHSSPLESPSVLQLGAVKLNGNMQLADSYFSYIKPNNEISDMAKIFDFMPISADNIIGGKDSSTALGEFAEWCGTMHSLYGVLYTGRFL